MMPGPMQIAIIVLVVILLFGAKKLPTLARSLGESMNELKKSKREFENEEKLAEAEAKCESEDAKAKEEAA